MLFAIEQYFHLIDQYFHIIDLCFPPVGLNAYHSENEVELIVQHQTLFEMEHAYFYHVYSFHAS